MKKILVLTDVPAKVLPILNLNHPGAHDQEYQQRRAVIVEKALQFHRLSEEKRQIPLLKYTLEEHQVWRGVCKKLKPLHQQFACSWYKEARKQLYISEEKIPPLRNLSKKLEQLIGFRLEPIHGLVEPKEFLIRLGRGIMLCTQYIRYASQPEFTPEPDIVHEVLGHVPMFLQPEFRAFSLLIGKAAALAHQEQLQKLIKLYWFTLEYGLIEEEGKNGEERKVKAFGAGLLGGVHDLSRAIEGKVTVLPFSREEIFKREINYSFPQEELFVLPSFKFLIEETEKTLGEMGLRAKVQENSCS